MATKKKIQPIMPEPPREFDLREFTISYNCPNNPEGVDRAFDGWLIEQLEDRFLGVSCDLVLATRERRIRFRR